MNSYPRQTSVGTHYGALMNQTKTQTMDAQLNMGEDEASNLTAAQLVVAFLKKSVSSLVVFSYLSLTVGQAYATGDKVVPFEGELSNLPMYSTPIKKNSVLPEDEENQGSPLSSTSSNTEQRRSESTVVSNTGNARSETDPLAAFSKAFELDDSGVQIADLAKAGYLAVSFSMDSVINAPSHIANAGIWMYGSAKKLWNREAEMPSEEAYYTCPKDFYRDNDYYGGHKDMYMQSLLTTALFASVVYSINAKAKFPGYTVFDAMAKKAEMYELLYYKHADDPYYYQDQFMDSMFIYSWIALPFFLLFESSELSKILWPTREESRLKEHHGFYTEQALNFLSVAIAVTAGYFAYSAYYTAAAGLLGTPQTTEKDLTTYPVFLGYSTALTMYTIARRGADTAYRYISREQYGDDAVRERGMNEEAIDFYQESMKKKFNVVKVSPEVKLSTDTNLQLTDSVDIEAQVKEIQKETKRTTLLDSSTTIEELETSLAKLNGTEVLTEIHDYWSQHKPAVKRHTSHNLASIETLRAQSEASYYSQFVQRAYNSAAWVVKNSWWIVPVIACTALVYSSFTSCEELVQWSIKGDPQAVSDYVLGQQATLKDEIIRSHEHEILSDPVKWLMDCFNSMKISANITDDENAYQYYYEANNNQTADYMLHFSTRLCLGISPFEEWIAAPKDLSINYDNAVMWFDLWKAAYASYADPQQTFSTTTNILAYIAAGIYTPTVYGLSVLGTSFVLHQRAEILMKPELTVSSKVLNILGDMLLTSPAFTQGVIEVASQGIEGYLAMDGQFDDAAVYACTGLITSVAALILTPDFYKVQKKIINKVKKLIYGRSALNELSQKFDALKELNDSAKSDILKIFDKSYKK